MSEKGVSRCGELHGVADVGSERACRDQLFALVTAPVADVAELARRTRRAEKDDLVALAVVCFNQVRLPAARFRIGASAALDADQVSECHEGMVAPVGEAR